MESEPINTTESLHQKVLDFLGKMSKEQKTCKDCEYWEKDKNGNDYGTCKKVVDELTGKENYNFLYLTPQIDLTNCL